MNSNSAISIRHLKAKQFSELESSGYYLQLTKGRLLNSEQHDHDFYEYICVISGSCIHTLDGKEMLLEAGNMALIHPGQIHFLSKQTNGTNVAALSLLSDEIMRFFYAFGTDDFPRTIQLEHGALRQIQQLCERIMLPCDGDTKLKMRTLLGLIFSDFAQAKAALQSSLPVNFETLLLQMNNIKSVSEGLPAFLRISNFSYSQLCRLTKQYLGETPGEYVKSLRIQSAYEMITGSTLDFEEICDTVGFSSYSHFCKLIRDYYGTTPAKLRNEAQKKTRTV